MIHTQVKSTSFNKETLIHIMKSKTKKILYPEKDQYFTKLSLKLLVGIYYKIKYCQETLICKLMIALKSKQKDTRQPVIF